MKTANQPPFALMKEGKENYFNIQIVVCTRFLYTFVKVIHEKLSIKFHLCRNLEKANSVKPQAVWFHSNDTWTLEWKQ